MKKQNCTKALTLFGSAGMAGVLCCVCCICVGACVWYVVKEREQIDVVVVVVVLVVVLVVGATNIVYSFLFSLLSCLSSYLQHTLACWKRAN